LKFIIVTISDWLFVGLFIDRTTLFRTFQNSIFEHFHADPVVPEVLAESVLLSVHPVTLQPLPPLPVVSPEPVLLVAGVGSDEDVAGIGREVTALTLELVRLEGTFVVAAIVKDLNKETLFLSFNKISSCNLTKPNVRLPKLTYDYLINLN
jgi:hypothetical protein